MNVFFAHLKYLPLQPFKMNNTYFSIKNKITKKQTIQHYEKNYKFTDSALINGEWSECLGTTA